MLIYLDSTDLGNNLLQKLTIIDKTNTIFNAENFENFFELINKKDFDYIFIDYNLTTIPATKLVEKLRSTNKFHRTIISYIKPKEIKISPDELRTVGIDYLIDADLETLQIEKFYKNSVLKYRPKLIPDDFQVLIVDDEPSIVEIIGEFLTDAGHSKFKSCNNLRSAIETISENDFDLILLDWNLGDGTCIDLIEAIKIHSSSERTRAATVVVITGRNEIDDMMTLLKYKIDDQIIKPFDFLEFEEKIDYALEKRNKKSLKPSTR
jgi:DNA-binding response OmpR family regulator